MPSVDNLVHEETTATGAGSLALANVQGRQSFNTAFGNGVTEDVFFYFISHRGAAEYEWGTGHMANATTLVRDTVYGGSNGTSAVNFSAGVKDVTNAVPAAGYDPCLVSAKLYGATGDGSTNDTAAIQAAIDAAEAMSPKGKVYLPRGTYNVTSLTITAAVLLYGDGRHLTTIRTTSASANVLTVTGQNASVRDIGFSASVTRTGGYYLVLSAAFILVDHIYLSGAHHGISIGHHVRINELYAVNTVANEGKVVVINAADQEVVLSNLVFDAPNASQPLYGIQVLEVGNLHLTAFEILHSGTGMIVNPSSGNATAIWANNGFFDSNSSHGCLIGPSGTGIVQECHFIGIWSATSASGNGFAIDASGSGEVHSISFTDCMSVNNASGQGIAILAGDNISITGGVFAANINGIYVDADVTDFSIIGVAAGDYGRFAGNSAWGINIISGGSDRYIISNNRLNGNTTGALTDNGTGVDKYVDMNVPVGANQSWVSWTPTITAGSGTFTSVAGAGKYLRRGRTVHFRVTITITTNGTAATDIRFSLPLNGSNSLTGVAGGGAARDNTTGPMCQCYIPANASAGVINRYDNTYPGNDSTTILAWGTYEI